MAHTTIMNSNFDKDIEAALQVLKAGGLILYPTDSVWGIGCDACNEEAVRKVFELKKRSDSKSLVLLAHDLDTIAAYIDKVPEMAIELVEVNDAPMTIIYPGAQTIGKYALAPSTVAQDGTVGIRIPSASAFCMELLRRWRKPLVSTSANISGEATPASFSEISAEISSGVDYVVDPHCEGRSKGKASQIIKVDLDGGITIIRS